MFSSSTGHDVKSLLINLWMSILFVAPVLWYFEIASIQHCMIAFALAYALAYLKSPVGWKRPHPYSDMEHNKIR